MLYYIYLIIKLDTNFIFLIRVKIIYFFFIFCTENLFKFEIFDGEKYPAYILTATVKYFAIDKFLLSDNPDVTLDN